jgi:hypothetical protein
LSRSAFDVVRYYSALVDNWMAENIELVVTVALSVGAIVATFVVFWWQRKPKHLDYWIMFDAPILSKRASSVSDLKVIMDDQELKAPHIVTVRVINSGKEPVKAEDYRDDITVTYSDGSPSLDASIPKESSPGIAGPPALHVGDRAVSVQPSLLNAKEWFDLQLICDGKPGDIKVAARFVGQTRPMRDLDPAPVAAFFFFVGGAVIMFLSAPLVIFDGPETLASACLYAGGALSLLGMGYLMFRTVRVPREKNLDMPGNLL